MKKFTLCKRNIITWKGDKDTSVKFSVFYSLWLPQKATFFEESKRNKNTCISSVYCS